MACRLQDEAAEEQEMMQLMNQQTDGLRQFVIRRAKVSDAPEVYRLFLSSVRGLCKSAYSMEDIEAWIQAGSAEIYEELIRSSIVLVCISSGDLVGFARLDVLNAEIAALYVHPRQV